MSLVSLKMQLGHILPVNGIYKEIRCPQWQKMSPFSLMKSLVFKKKCINKCRKPVCVNHMPLGEPSIPKWQRKTSNWEWLVGSLCCNDMYTFSGVENNAWRYHRWVDGSKTITSIWRSAICVVTWVWKAPFKSGLFFDAHVSMLT